MNHRENRGSGHLGNRLDLKDKPKRHKAEQIHPSGKLFYFPGGGESEGTKDKRNPDKLDPSGKEMDVHPLYGNNEEWELVLSPPQCQ